MIEPEHHGNPVDPESSLGLTDFGDQLPKTISSINGMRTRHCRDQIRKSGVIGDSVIVLPSQKQPDLPLAGHTGRRQASHQ